MDEDVLQRRRALLEAPDDDARREEPGGQGIAARPTGRGDDVEDGAEGGDLADSLDPPPRL